MYKGKRIIAIIPARSGSKGIKNKNIRTLNGIPLIAHSSICAKRSEIIDEIFLSTDSEEYAEIAKLYGANVPFLRPINISTDRSQAYDYVINALTTYKDQYDKIFDYFIVLQPTSPIRRPEHITDVVKMLVDNNIDSVVSVCEADHIPQIYNHLPENMSMDGFYKEDNNSFNRQDFGKYYRLNGSIYAMNTCEFLKTKSYYIQNSRAYIMDKKYSIDIDDELDLYFAEKILAIE